MTGIQHLSRLTNTISNMLVQQVIDEDTPDKPGYTIQPKPLGEGGTATILRGIDQSRVDKNQVAVKVANPSSTAAELEDFWAELNIIRELAHTPAQHNVPWAHRGSSPDAAQLAMIVMELVPDEWQLGRFGFENGGRVPEALAAQAAAQYAALLVELHKAEITMRGDRKATDIRWDVDATPPRLIVLDWNRARKIPSTVLPDLRQELICQDLRGFARLWSEFTLGQRVKALEAVDETRNAVWSGLSRAWRTILTRAWDAGNAGGYSDAKSLARALAQHVASLKAVDRKDAAYFLTQAQELRDEFIPEEDVAHQAAVADQIMTLTDFARRTGDTGTAIADQIRNLETFAQQFASAQMQRFHETLDRVKEKLSQEDYESAVELSDLFLKRLERVDPEGLRIYQELIRWYWVSRAGVKGNDLRVKMEQPILKLIECVTNLEQANKNPNHLALLLQVAARALEQTDGLPPEIHSILKPLDSEIQIRQGLNETFETTERDTATFLKNERVKTLWLELAGIDPVFAASLKFGLPLLASYLQSWFVESATQKQDATAQTDFQASVARLQIALDSHRPVAVWMDLTNEIRQARAAYQKMIVAVGKVSEQDRAALDFVAWLEQVNLGMVQENYYAAAQLVQTPDLSSLVKAQQTLVAARCSHVIAASVAGAQQDWRWPHELRDAQKLLTVVNHFEGLGDKDRQALGDTNKFLADWEARLNEFRNKLGFQHGENDFARLLLNPSQDVLVQDGPANDEIDEILRTDAKFYKIELFDFTLFPEQKIACRVESILAQRQMARLEARTKKLMLELGVLREDLAQVIEVYPEQASELAKSAEAAIQTASDFERVATRLQTTRFASLLSLTRTRVEGLTPVIQQWKNLDLDLAHLQNSIRLWEDIKTSFDPLDVSQMQSQIKAVNDLATELKQANAQAALESERAQALENKIAPLVEWLQALIESNIIERFNALPAENIDAHQKFETLVNQILDDRLAAQPSAISEDRIVEFVNELIAQRLKSFEMQSDVQAQNLRELVTKMLSERFPTALEFPSRLREWETRKKSEQANFKAYLENLISEWSEIRSRLEKVKQEGSKMIVRLLPDELEFLIELTLPAIAMQPHWVVKGDWYRLSTAVFGVSEVIKDLGTSYERQRLWVNKLHINLQVLITSSPQFRSNI